MSLALNLMKLMTQDIGFLEAIADNPEDDSVRLIYADWLDDHGDHERAEFIRVQCELASLPFEDYRRVDLTAREEVLLEKNRERWLAPLWSILEPPRNLISRFFHTLANLAEYNKNPQFDLLSASFAYGFVDDLHLSEAQFTKLGGALLRVAPWLQFHINSLGSYLKSFFKSPHIEYLRSLSLYFGSDEQETIFNQLGTSSRIRKLNRLFLHSDDFDTDLIRRLFNSPLALQLTGLGLSGFPYFSGVETSEERLRDSASLNIIRTLAYATPLQHLRRLILSFNDLGDEGIEVIANSPNLAELRCLDLRENRVTDIGAKSLATSPYLLRVRELHLSSNPITQVGLNCLKERFGKAVYFIEDTE